MDAKPSSFTDVANAADPDHSRPIIRDALSVPVLRYYLTSDTPECPYRKLEEWSDEEIVVEARWLLNISRESSALHGKVQRDHAALQAFIVSYT